MKNFSISLIICCGISTCNLNAQWSINQIGVQPGLEALDIEMDEGRNDGIQRIYVTSRAGNITEWTYASGNWNTTTVTATIQPVLINLAIGNGRNDGIKRLYFNEHTDGGAVYEATWNGSSWNVATVVSGTSGVYPTSVTVGNGRGDGVDRLYIGNAGGGAGVYEYTWNGSSWNVATVYSDTYSESDGEIGNGRNDGTDRLYNNTLCPRESSFSGSWSNNYIANCSTSNYADALQIGDGRNDGVSRIYSNSEAGGQTEYTWNGSNWIAVQIANQAQRGDIHLAPLHSDALNRVYLTSSALAWNGTLADHMYEYEWNATNAQWQSNGVVMDVTTGATGWMASGNGRNDDTLRLYAPDFATGVIYEITSPTPNYTGNPSSINELNNMLDIQVFPVPARDEITIELIADANFPIALSVTNLIGEQIIPSKKMNSNNEMILKVHNYAEGVYLVRIDTPFGEQIRKIIIE